MHKNEHQTDEKQNRVPGPQWADYLGGPRDQVHLHCNMQIVINLPVSNNKANKGDELK